MPAELSKEIFQSLFLIILLFLIIQILKISIRRFSAIKSIDLNRRRIISKLTNFFLYLITGIILAGIWGVAPSQFAVYISSVLALLGVGFFAQWSILSNLTSSVILFFAHPLRIGDRIRVLDKDFNWIGEVKDISGFFFYENGSRRKHNHTNLPNYAKGN